MKKGYDFSRGVRGKFYSLDGKLNLPVDAATSKLKAQFGDISKEIQVLGLKKKSEYKSSSKKTETP